MIEDFGRRSRIVVVIPSGLQRALVSRRCPISAAEGGNPSSGVTSPAIELILCA